MKRTLILNVWLMLVLLLLSGVVGCSKKTPETAQPSPEKASASEATPQTKAPATAPSGTGDKPGQVKTPVSPAQIQSFVWWQDPQETAFQVLLPDGWQVSGGTQRVNTDYTFQLEATKDKAQFLLRYPVPAQNWAPTPYTEMLGFQEGTFFKSLGFDWFLLRYYPPPQYIAQLIVEPMKQQYPDARIVQVENQPQLAGASKIYNATMTEAASATVAFSAGGLPMKAGFTVITNYFAGPQNSTLWIATVFGAIAPETEFQQVSQMAMMAIASLRIDPAWLQAEIEGAKTRRAMVEATAKRLRELNYFILQEESKATLNIGGNWAAALGGSYWEDDKGNPLPDPGYDENPSGTPSGANIKIPRRWAEGPDGRPATISGTGSLPPGYNPY